MFDNLKISSPGRFHSYTFHFVRVSGSLPKQSAGFYGDKQQIFNYPT